MPACSGPALEPPAAGGLTPPRHPLLPPPKVGRTGSGKSTLLLALFRLLRIDDGRVTLDGVDTAAVPVARLRSHLALIPQTPLLFSGTVRANLDPTGALAGRPGADAEMWRLLRQVGLAGVIKGLGGLDAPLPTGGGALAVGHKQLLSLTRCLRRVCAGAGRGSGCLLGRRAFKSASPVPPRPPRPRPTLPTSRPWRCRPHPFCQGAPARRVRAGHRRGHRQCRRRY
jgi:hypothetical protein